jgi:hypothetical protein
METKISGRPLNLHHGGGLFNQSKERKGLDCANRAQSVGA